MCLKLCSPSNRLRRGGVEWLDRRRFSVTVVA